MDTVRGGALQTKLIFVSQLIPMILISNDFMSPRKNQGGGGESLQDVSPDAWISMCSTKFALNWQPGPWKLRIFCISQLRLW